jgi:tRNA pseudouridine55 synthase
VPPARTEVSSALAVIDKPAGWTSHQVVGRVRRLVGTRRVGHAGTLDPMATGVLLVGIERATRLLGYLSLTDKTYQATIRLGISTVTDDAEGELRAEVGAAGLTGDQIDVALAPLRGDIAQVPSSVSAIQVNGVRSYARVRAGQDVDLAARPVTVRRLEVLDRRDETVHGVACVDLDVVVECTSGTYIRALARDLGAALGVGGHLTALRRTAVGPFAIQEAHPLDADTAMPPVLGLTEVVRRNFPVHTLAPDQAVAVGHGRRLPGLRLPAPLTALLDIDDTFLALYRQVGTDAVPEAVFAPASG